MINYYVRTQINLFDESTQKWKLEDRYTVVYKFINFSPGDESMIIMDKDFEPDHVNDLVMYEDFTDNGMKMIDGVVTDPPEYI